MTRQGDDREALQRQVADLERRVRRQQNELETFRTSTSWRVTAPLRSLGNAARWASARLRGRT